MSQTITASAISACLVVSDLETALSWWRRAFGFEIEKHIDLPEYGMSLAFIGNGAIMLELVQPRTFEPFVRPGPPDYLNRQGVSQVSIRVNDLDAAFTKTQALNLTVEWPPTDNAPLALRAFLLRDPDGNIVEVIEHISQGGRDAA
jgi:catechol 2,3-dioxygenase-like lactoylglutathione lyase family enzyme